MQKRIEFYNNIKLQYDKFRNKIINEIKRKIITNDNENIYCLIETSWLDEITKKDNYLQRNNVYFYTKKMPVFIDKISNKINKKFQPLEKKNILGLLFHDYEYKSGELNIIMNLFNNSENYKYVAGFEKLLIISEDNLGLLILNPYNVIIKKKFIIGIIFKILTDFHSNNDFYEKLLNNNYNINNIENNLTKNIIIDESEKGSSNNLGDLSKAFEIINKYKYDSLIKKNIILIFSSIYYYENKLKANEKEKAFDQYEEYYLINYDWLNKYKSAYNYNKISELLKDLDKNNIINPIDYYKLRNYEFLIIEKLKNTALKKSDNFYLDINEINKNTNNYNECYIMHDKILAMIFELENVKFTGLSKKKIRIKNSYIYISDSFNTSGVTIGILNEKLLFITQYIITFESKSIYADEIKNLLNYSIEDYLKERNCSNKDKNDECYLNLYKNNNSIGKIEIICDINAEKKKKEKEILINENINKENEKYKEDLENANKELDKQKKENELLKENYKKISKDLNNKKKELNEINIQNEKIINENKLLSKKSNELSTMNEDLQKHIELLKNEKSEEDEQMNEKYKELLIKYESIEKQKSNESDLIDQILEENNNTKNENKILEEELKKEKIENDNLRKKHLEIEDQLKEKELLIKDLENKNNQNEKEIKLLKNTNQNNDEKNKKFSDIIDEKENIIKELKNNELNLKDEIKQKENELAKYENQITEYVKDLSQKENEINDLNKIISKKDEEFSKLNNLYNDLQKDHQEKNNLLNEKQKELEKIENENLFNKKNLKEIQDLTSNINQEYQNKIIELKSKISEISKELEGKNKENQNMKKELESKREQLDKNKIMLENMNHGLEEVKNKCDEKDKKLKNYEELINSYKDELNSSKSKIEKLKEDYEKKIRDNEVHLDDIINSMDNNSIQMKKDNDLLKSKNEELNKELLNLTKLNEQLNKKEKELNVVIQLKNNEINGLKNSVNEGENMKNEFKKVLDLNKELNEKNKNLENKENEFLNKLNEYKNKENQYLNKLNEYKNREQEFNQVKNQKIIDNSKKEEEKKTLEYEIYNLEQSKNKLDTQIYDLTLKLSQLEENIKEKKKEYENICSEIKKIKDEKNIKPKLSKDIISLEYKIPPNVGLNNVGATCFMNSTLQCFSHTKELTNYFLNPQNKERIFNNNIALKDPKELQLTPLYYELIFKLWAKDGSKTYSPYNFMNGIQSMNPLFQKGQAGDAKDFIIFILEQIHRELKISMNKEKKDNMPPLNQYDNNNSLQHFLIEFKEELSIISDTFFGFNETTNICLSCKNEYGSKGMAYPICYNYGIFNCIIFPLEEVKKMRNNVVQMFNMANNNAINIIHNDRVSISDCFFYNQKTDKFTGENQNYCNICKKLSDSDYTSRIYVAPNVLILILNRGKNNMYDVKIDFTHIIEITNFVLLKDKPRILYSLYGVITHIGKSGPYAHFVASCKSPVDGNWYRFNDGLVSPIYDFKKEVHDFANPYVLFYQKIKDPQNMNGI